MKKTCSLNSLNKTSQFRSGKKNTGHDSAEAKHSEVSLTGMEKIPDLLKPLKEANPINSLHPPM